jgi:hypothetical protein
MVERFGRLFARQLRSLCELRKAPLAVVVQSLGGQVNVGGRQVNVAPTAGGWNGAAQNNWEGRRPHARPEPCTCTADRAPSR